eukprot:CAMPEP_0115023466 /NCGR_PEP_ID=MMETSP0216-20121206/32412_1 /TAXON_ID=223996 /ORGANISM="Protocruzia adherens, Strain Boccale" /LENGTH=786 /DNA_ID=CAMNT_0002396845 /DNA_START=266 /DNA_END=2626 /DNA_ORIENTATION=-
MTIQECEGAWTADGEGVVNVVRRIYEGLTGKVLPDPPVSNLPDYNNPGNRATLLMKDRELHRIPDASTQLRTMEAALLEKQMLQQIEEEQTETLKSSSPSKTREYIIEKGPQRKVTRNADVIQQTGVEIAGVKLKTVTRNVAQLRATKEMSTMMSMQRSTHNQSMSESLHKSSIESPQNINKSIREEPQPRVTILPIISILNEIVSAKIEASRLSLADGLLKLFQPTKDSSLLYFENLSEFSDEFNNEIFDTMTERMSVVIDCISRDDNEFWTLMHLIFGGLKQLLVSHSSFMHLIQFLTVLGNKMISSQPEETQRMFIEYGLDRVAAILNTSPEKREFLCHLIYCYCVPDPQSRIQMIKQLKDRLENTKTFISALSRLITYETEYNEDITDIFLYYALIGLNMASPVMRACSCSIIATISKHNAQTGLNMCTNLAALSGDSWWEIRAQLLVCVANIITSMDEDAHLEFQKYDMLDQMNTRDGDLSRMSEGSKMNTTHNSAKSLNSSKPQKSGRIATSPEQANLRDNIESLMDVLIGVFNAEAPQNLLKIGLIYLAPVAHYNSHLLRHYVELLLGAPEEVRSNVLDSNPMQAPNEDLYVLGGNAMRYRLAGAPLTWDSLQIVNALAEVVKSAKLDALESEHVDIITSAIGMEIKGRGWIEFFQEMNDYIYTAACDRDLCQSVLHILERFYFAAEIQRDVFKISSETFVRALGLLYDNAEPDEQCQTYIAKFLEGFAQKEATNPVVAFVYDLLKAFSEQYKEVFEASNLKPIWDQVSVKYTPRTKYY